MLGGELTCAPFTPPTATCPYRGGIALLNMGSSATAQTDGTGFDLAVDGGIDQWTCADAGLEGCTCRGWGCPDAGLLAPGALPAQVTFVAMSFNEEPGGPFANQNTEPGGVCLSP